MSNTATIKSHSFYTGNNTSSTWHTFQVSYGRKLYHVEVLIAVLGNTKLHASTFDCYRDGGSNQTPQGSRVRRDISDVVEYAAITKVREERSCNEILALLGL